MNKYYLLEMIEMRKYKIQYDSSFSDHVKDESRLVQMSQLELYSY